MARVPIAMTGGWSFSGAFGKLVGLTGIAVVLVVKFLNKDGRSICSTVIEYAPMPTNSSILFWNAAANVQGSSLADLILSSTWVAQLSNTAKE
jgi:hypothetical protein